jgi:Tfp pilus assembly protein PilV
MSLNVHNKSLTLLELILAVILMSMVVIGFTGIDVFTRQSVISADRRAKVQNSIAYVLAHMTKNIAKAINDPTNSDDPNSPITWYPVNDDPSVEIRVDSDNDGRYGSADKKIAYSYNATNQELRYYPDSSVPGTYDIISDKVFWIDAYYSNTTNYLKINVTGRWDLNNATVSPENPQINMTTYVDMPSVSARH